ncbi:MAG: tryptophan synthase subunit alpha, partial [Myxococcota bacterium]
EDGDTILDALVTGGADAVELGIAFSDPIADGPTIQAASVRALAAGMTPPKSLAMVQRFRARHPDVPVGLLVYANLVEAKGRPAFYRQASEAGVDSVLVADVPTLEAAPFCAQAEAVGIDPVLILPPQASPSTLDRVAALSRGYTYVVTRPGVTGAEVEAGVAEDEALRDQSELLRSLAERGAAPPVMGFGISTPEHVARVRQSGAAGAIVGSALVRRIAESTPATRAATIEQYLSTLKARGCP